MLSPAPGCAGSYMKETTRVIKPLARASGFYGFRIHREPRAGLLIYLGINGLRPFPTSI